MGGGAVRAGALSVKDRSTTDCSSGCGGVPLMKLSVGTRIPGRRVRFASGFAGLPFDIYVFPADRLLPPAASPDEADLDASLS